MAGEELGRGCLLDRLIQDPSGLPPLCSEARFAELLEGMVADDAPRVFAVVQEFGDRVDARIAGWGIAFDDRVEVIGVDGDVRMSLREPEDALRRFRRGSRIGARVVWVSPEAAMCHVDDDAG
ncbi:hypothetical protein SAMN06265360_107163 [Haloechinothrix alba]|uniref:Uncharacterized protein n=1 Tax=Haloechinothrix alba TaxID=664784 RepID=A0A238WUZ0_9PSEU|nr:hypothetical protein SAMN06265360_107163 [Haloechinothrix alba]